jgi:hypothetical protein
MTAYEDARARLLKLRAEITADAPRGEPIPTIEISAVGQFLHDVDTVLQTPGTSNANINAGRIDELFARLDRLEERMSPSVQQPEPEQSPRPEWLPADAADQIMEVAPADNLNDVVDLITRWYNDYLFNMLSDEPDDAARWMEWCRRAEAERDKAVARQNELRHERDAGRGQGGAGTGQDR